MPFPAVIELSSLDGINGFRIEGAGEDDISGRSVSGAGDVNGDGFDDLIIGAPSAVGGSGLGASYVVFGSNVGFDAAVQLSELDGTNGFRVDGATAYDFSGSSVSGAGDVNGDGFDDLIVGAPEASPGGALRAGSSYVVFGVQAGFAAALDLDSLDGTNGFRLDGDFRRDGVAENDHSGFSVSGAGDVNDDGFDDVIVGAPAAGNYAGASYVIFGTAAGFDAALDLAGLDGNDGFRIDGVAPRGTSGFSVSDAGDVNGDGIDDLIVGALLADPGPGRYGAGSSYVVFGTAAGFAAAFDLASLNGSNGFRVDGVADFDQSGFSVSRAGDVNGDGFDDVIVGARFADPGGRYGAGSSYVVFGNAGGFSAVLDLADLDGTNGFRLDGVAAEDFSGYSVSGAGDFNGDGFDDLIVGAPSATPDGRVYSGSSYLVFGKAADFAAALDLGALDGTDGFRLDGVSEVDFSGSSVSGAGDINGDGFDDLLIGASIADPGGRDRAGTSYVVFGRSTGPVARNEAATTDQARPVAVDVLANDGGTIVGGPALTRQPSHGLAMLLADDTLAYLPDPDFVGHDSFRYRIGDGHGLTDRATVRVEVVEPTITIRGNNFGQTLLGRGTGELIEGRGGADDVRGLGGDDTLLGGSGSDFLQGGAGDDVLIGGRGSDLLNGGSGADLFVLTDLDSIDRIGRLDPLEGDRLLIAIAELLLPDGSLDGSALRIEDAGTQKRILADVDGDGHFTKIAQINGGAGLDPDDFLANAITIA